MVLKIPTPRIGAPEEMENTQPRVVRLESGDRRTRGYRRYALGLLLAVFTLNFMDRQILAILIQPIKQDLQLSDSALGLLSGFAFALGPHLGLFLGFLVGGWLNQWYGWRVAFLAAGMPGLLLAGVVRVTLKDPPRGLADRLTAPVGERPRLAAVWRDMWSRPSLRHILAGGALASFVAYGFIIDSCIANGTPAGQLPPHPPPLPRDGGEDQGEGGGRKGYVALLMQVSIVGSPRIWPAPGGMR